MNCETCTTCNKELKSGGQKIEDKFYCISPCGKEALKTCCDCKIERPFKNFPDFKENCWTCEVKKINLYDTDIVPNILAIFEKFKASHPHNKNARVLGDDEFKVLTTDLVANLNSGYWAGKFLASSSRLFFDEKQALELWKIVTSNVPSKNIYQFIHAMGSSLLLSRRMYTLDSIEQGHGVWRYYREARDEKSILEQWNNAFQWTYNCGTFSISQCGICLEDISSCANDKSGRYATCIQCLQLSHAHCKLKYLASSSILTCEYCRYNYKKEDDIKFHHYDVYRCDDNQSSGFSGGRLLNWKDHLDYLLKTGSMHYQSDM